MTEGRKIITNLITEFYDIFHVNGDGLTFAKNVEHGIFPEPRTNPENTMHIIFLSSVFII